MEQAITKWTNSSTFPDVSTPERIAHVRMKGESPRYSSGEREARISWMAWTLGRMKAICHIPIIDKELGIDAAAIDDTVMGTEMAGLTLAEIDDAFKRGLSGEWEEVRGVTAFNMVRCLRMYLESERRIDALAIEGRAVQDRQKEWYRQYREKLRRETEGRGHNPRGWWKTDSPSLADFKPETDTSAPLPKGVSCLGEKVAEIAQNLRPAEGGAL